MVVKHDLILREECRLNIFKNRILSQIFASKSNANVDLTRLHNEELHSLYRLPNIVRMIKSIRWEGHVARMEEVRSAFKI